MTTSDVTVNGEDPAAQRLDITRVPNAHGIGLTVAGEIDSFSVPVLADSLERAVAETDGPIVVDLTAVTFIDSSGITALVTAQSAACGRLRLDPIPTLVRRILEITGLLDQFSGSDAARLRLVADPPVSSERDCGAP